MKNIIQQFSQLASIEKWLADTKHSNNQLVLGLSGSAKHLAEAALFEKLDKMIVIVTPTVLQATQTYEELSEWYPNEEIYLFSSEESLAAETAFVSPEVRAGRIETLEFLLEGKKGIVVLPVAALRKRLVPVAVWRQQVKRLAIGEEITSLEELSQQLVQMGYKFETMVQSPGEYAIRGGIVDIYPLNQEYPLRIDLFDTEIDSIRLFDVETQRSLEVIEEVVVLPATDLPILVSDVFRAKDTIVSVIEKAIKKSTSVELAEQLRALKEYLIGQLLANEIPENIEWWLEAIYPGETTVLDYCMEATHLVLDDYPRLLEKERQLSEEDAHWMMHRVSQGRFSPNLSMTIDIKKTLKKFNFKRTYFAIFQKGMGRVQLDCIHNINYRGMTQFFSQLPLIKSETERYKKQNATIMMVVESKKAAQKLEQTLEDFEINATVTDGQLLLPGKVQIMVGNLQNGFELPQDKFVMITERELFNKIKKRIPKKQKLSNAERLKSYTELQVGDYVVHVNHGIGIYKGMETLEINGIHQDYMSISYKDGGNLFVPITQVKLIQKYVASESKEPKINKLGGTEWAKTKRKVASKIEDIADELIELYAKRDSEKGFAFSKDAPEQHEFEEAFPYTETDDQLRTVEEIKKDMEKERPMDRLLVGDVGYGKTEVAMRAVFKAVMDGKQVAILVPTTILAEQHYENFIERFNEYPFNIGLLSRFRTKKQQDETIEGLKQGQVDIVIGTHRVLSKDVEFLDLGLLVVDEEQRFGVRHKERLKQLKSQVDVLTLTATPIPRTLHMSMLGVRELSVIETPPANRYPVQTYVLEQDALTIKDGIEREMGRGGQVFYLHNRVDSIERKAEEIKALVPGVRVGVAHGRMSESTLESVLYQFIEGEYDVLVTTTIIETGVNIPNVNTLFIEDANRMGLSQLYQLRGRVGRFNRVAYAYLMYQPNKSLTEVSENRLQAMREFTELGSGFKIAMRDLSIRGAGNLLGKQQHGFIDSVGFDLYSEMLSEAVRKKQGKQMKLKDDTVEIDISVDAYLPNKYIQDERQKIEIYKRIRSLETEEEYDALLDDLIDRFGEFPDEVAYLAEIGMIKAFAEKVGVTLIKRNKTVITITINAKGKQYLQGVPIFEALKDIPLAAQVADKGNTLQLTINVATHPTDRWLLYLKKILKNLAEKINQATATKEEGE
ncbi:transcription-repair coupling factor [Granulicatella balaenopterae]|uniref:Transcription-repair-coupling factor n=1 Tax=Granulicatella balaenopterae TaxID=137733 RepID=A0A1H9JCN9_9LACT|nr:transcription-repair coupling factor [Granulicatella balaenopterae]SEQ84602.1 transcription-repair coupling factor [Granulicatella balaenopterae]